MFVCSAPKVQKSKTVFDFTSLIAHSTESQMLSLPLEYCCKISIIIVGLQLAFDKRVRSRKSLLLFLYCITCATCASRGYPVTLIKWLKQSRSSQIKAAAHLTRAHTKMSSPIKFCCVLLLRQNHPTIQFQCNSSKYSVTVEAQTTKWLKLPLLHKEFNHIKQVLNEVTSQTLSVQCHQDLQST